MKRLLIRAGTGRRGRDYDVIATLLQEALDEYTDHQSWRCQYPDRYPQDPDCPCGLIEFRRRATEVLG